MGYEFNFEKLDVYQEAVSFVGRIYQTTRSFPKDELYGLVSQLRRAAVSIVSNICEGSNRGRIEFKRFLDISRGSVFECVGQLRVAFELKYIDEGEMQDLKVNCVKLSKMLIGLRQSI